MHARIHPDRVRDALLADEEIALLDVRDESSHAGGHPLFAASIPLGRLETEILDRVPRRATPVVVMDDDGTGSPDAPAERAAAILTDSGYVDVRVLEGGVTGWALAGGELFIDVNAPSKAFGELVESVRRTPSLAAQQVAELIASGAPVRILDVRRFEEYRTMSIPTATSVPGGELVRRVADLDVDPATTIIVNCAGRTRSIMGTQSLINAEVTDAPVYALRNGTIGWTLAGLSLDHGQQRALAPTSRPADQRAIRGARLAAERAGVRFVDAAGVLALLANPNRTTYRFDVRSPGEFEAGHLRGFRSAPGGQLVQETDVFAPVRGARIVLVDDDGVRAAMTGSWLAQMHWDVVVPEGGLASLARHVGRVRGPWRPATPPAPAVPVVTAPALHEGLSQGRLTVVDLAPSPAYKAGHIPGAWFAIRSTLLTTLASSGILAEGRTIVITSGDGRLAPFVVAELLDAGVPAATLVGGTEAWIAQGFPVEQGTQRLACPAEDVYRRPYEGTDVTREAMQAYLDWEYGLVAQLERDGTHKFEVLQPVATG